MTQVVADDAPKSKTIMNFGGSVRLNPCGLAVLALVALALVYLNWPSSYAGVSGNNDDYVSMKDLLSVSIEVARRGGREVKRIREEVS